MPPTTLSPARRSASPGRALANLPVRLKLALLAAVSMLAMLALAGWLVWLADRDALAGRQTSLRQNVETASAVLAWAHGLETRGVLGRAQAQALALQVLRGARYGGQEYFWVNDMTPRVLMHPIKPALDGQDVSALVDPDGVPLFQRFVATVRSQGAGFVAYRWPKPGQDQPVEKLSYVAGFQPWGWVVGTGVYIDDLRTAFWQHLRGVGLAMLLALGVTGLALQRVGSSICRGLAHVAGVAQSIACGDVSQAIAADGRDELGRLTDDMRAMSEQLNQTMGKVHQAAASLAGASAQIAAANQDLSGRTERAAASLQQVAGSLGLVTGSVQGNAAVAERALHTVGQAQATAADGGAVVDRAVLTMGEVRAASHRIGDIVGVIDGIAFQTNILALNAAVEAARAGSQGRGFAVVAAEVRQLAGRAAGAAREIRQLIQASVDRTDAGADLVQAAGASMQRIMAAVADVHALMGEVALASAEQSGGIGEVHAHVGGLDQMTQQNAALVEQSAAAAEALRDQATRLHAAVQRFRLRAPA